MEINNLERIIFQERDIAGIERTLETWIEYANAERDIYSENAHVLSECEETIARLSTEIDGLSDRPIAWNCWIYDIYCDNNFRSRNEFIKQYPSVLRRNARNEFHRLINYYGPESAKEQCVKVKRDIEIERAQLDLMMRKLTRIEKIHLNIMRKSPIARINSSPSFIMCAVGESMSKHFAKGLAEGLAEGGETDERRG